MYFEKNLDKDKAIAFIRGLDVDEQSVQISVSEFISLISDIDAWEKSRGIRVWKTDEAWGTEIYDADSDSWIKTGFEEPL